MVVKIDGNIEKIVSDPAVTKAFAEIILEASRFGADRIHIRPDVDATEIKYEVNSVVRDTRTVHVRYSDLAVIIRHIAHLKKTDEPQESERVRVNILGKHMEYINLKVSTYPPSEGERILLQLYKTEGLGI